MTKTDNEWAAELMGLEPFHWEEGRALYIMSGTRRYADFAHDANDFRQLLNCEAVRKWLQQDFIPSVLEGVLDRWFGEARLDQPGALKSLREDMEDSEPIGEEPPHPLDEGA